MISYEQLCETLDRYNARRRGETLTADDPAQPAPEMALTGVPAGQPTQAPDHHAVAAEELSDSIEVDESMIAAHEDSAGDQPSEWEAIPLTGDLDSSGLDSSGLDSSGLDSAAAAPADMASADLASPDTDGLPQADDELPPS